MGPCDLSVHYKELIIIMLQSKITDFAKDAGLNGVNTGKIIHKAIRN